MLTMSPATPNWIRTIARTSKMKMVESTERVRAAGNTNRFPEEALVSVNAKTDDDPDAVVPWSVRAAAEWSWRLLIIVTGLAVLVYALYWMQIIVVPLLVATLIAVLLEPINQWLRRYLRFPRALAALTTVVGTLAAIAALLTFAGQALVDGFADIADSAAAGFDRLLTWLSEGPLHIDATKINEFQAELVSKVQDNATTLASGALSITSSLGQVLSGALIAIFCLFFFLMEGRRIWLWCVRLLPVGARERTHEAAIRGWLSLRGYARTQILVAAVDAIGIGVGAWLLGVPLYLPLGVLVFLGSFVPIVGALVTGTIAVLVALVSHGLSTAVFMLIVVLAVQQIEGNVLQPFLMGHAVSLHPVAVLLAVAGATYVAGIVGALFVVPFVAFLNTVILYFNGRDKFPALASDPARPGGPPGAFSEQIEGTFEDSIDVAEHREAAEIVDGINEDEIEDLTESERAAIRAEKAKVKAALAKQKAASAKADAESATDHAEQAKAHADAADERTKDAPRD